MNLNIRDKTLLTAPISDVLIEGESNANEFILRLPTTYERLDLTTLRYTLRAVNTDGTAVEQELAKEIREDGLRLTWRVTGPFTAQAGPLSLELRGVGAVGQTVIKFTGKPVQVRQSLSGIEIIDPEEPGGTSDYIQLSNKPKINGITLAGELTLAELGAQPAGDYAAVSQLPTKVSQLENDSGFVTEAGSGGVSAEQLNTALEPYAKTADVAAAYQPKGEYAATVHNHDGVYAKKEEITVLDAVAAFADNAYTLTGLPETLPAFFTVRFKAPNAYVEGAGFVIGGIAYTPKNAAFELGDLISMDCDREAKRCFFKVGGSGGGGGNDCTVLFENYLPLGEIHGMFDDLSSARRNLAATTVGDKGLFGGGYSLTDAVEAYTETGIRSNFPVLSAKRESLAAATVGDQAIFGGGYASPTNYNNVDAYTSNGTNAIFTSLTVGRQKLAAATVGDKALFGGGFSGTSTYSNNVDAYTKAGVRTAASTLSVARTHLTATTLSTKAIFGGGYGGNTVDTMDAYTSSGSRTNFTALSVARRELASAVAGDKALFGGGELSSGFSGTVDAYTVSGVRTTFAELVPKNGWLSAASLGARALFIGGYSGGSSRLKSVVAYTAAGVRTIYPDLAYGRYYAGATTVGNKAVVAGGGSGSYATSTVEWYINLEDEEPNARITVWGGGVYNFGNGEVTVSGKSLTNSAIVDVPRPVNGYIKYKGEIYNG